MNEYKKCSHCKEKVCSTLFYKSKNTKDGLQTTCKICYRSRVEYNKEYREKNKEVLAASNKKWNEENKAHVKQRKKLKYLENASKHKADRREHYLKNKSDYLHWSKLRKYRISMASPSWLTPEMLVEIKNIYKLSKNITLASGIPHEVDHIVPLNGDEVCGLHVPWNLRVITKEENRLKFNLLSEDLIKELNE